MSCLRVAALFKRTTASLFLPHPQSYVKLFHCNAFRRPRSLPAVLQRPALLRQQPYRSASSGTHQARAPLDRAKDMVIGALVLVGLTSGSSFIYQHSGKVTYEKVPLTNRSRMLWADKKFDEEIGHPVENWLLNMREKSRLSEDDPVTKLVREVLDRLLAVDVAKGLNFKLYVFDDFADPNAYGAPALEGGRIFINTGCIHSCKKVEELAAVLAHEMGHVIARHILEKNFSTKLAQSVANWFGFKGAIGTDLITARMQEEEADRMGLLIMSEAGFNPELRLEYLKDRLKQETEYLAGREPLPEFLSTHPSSETRIKVAEAMMPEAKKLFQKKGNVVSEIKGWEESRRPLEALAQQHADLIAINDQMRPDVLLRRIEGTIGELVGAWNGFARAAQGVAEDEENAKEAATAQQAITDAVQELEVAQKIIKEELSEDTSDVTTTIGPGTEGTSVLLPQTTTISAAEDSHGRREEDPPAKD